MSVLQISRIVGDINDQYGSWVHSFTPQDRQKLNARGHFLAVVALKKINPQADLTVIGKEVILRLHETYYSNLDEPIFEHLKHTLETALAETNQNFEPQIIIASILDNVLYLAGTNTTKALICRSNRLNTVFTGGLPVSGFLEQGDFLCLATSQFFDQLAEGSLQAAFGSGSPTQISEAIVPLMHGHFDQQEGRSVEGLIGALIVGINFPPEAEGQSESYATEEKTRKFSLPIAKLNPLKLLPSLSLSENEFLKEKLRRKLAYLPIVGLLLFALILGLNIFGGKKRQQQTNSDRFAVILQAAYEKKEEGDGLISLNASLAKQTLLEAQDLARQAEAVDPNGEGLNEFKTKLQSSLDKVIKEYPVESKVFFDLELIKQEASGDDFVFAQDKLIVLDKKQSTLYSVQVPGKKYAILSGGQFLASGLVVAAAKDRYWLVGSQGIYSQDKKVSDFIPKQEQVSAFSYLSNLYLLDPNDNTGEIWRFSADTFSLSEPQKWLQSEVNLNEVISMAIDGSVWTITQGGEIQKFVRGQSEKINISGLSKKISQAKQIFTDADSQFLYIFDAGNNRIVVVNKSGQYQAEYLDDKLSKTTKIAVVESQKKVFLLSGSKIYEFELK